MSKELPGVSLVSQSESDMVEAEKGNFKYYFSVFTLTFGLNVI